MWLRDRERRLPGESQVAAERLPACAETNLLPDGSYHVSDALGALAGTMAPPLLHCVDPGSVRGCA